MTFEELPRYVKIALNGASGVGKCYVNNAKVNEFFCDKFSLFTDGNEQEISGFGKIGFDWKAEKWFAVF